MKYQIHGIILIWSLHLFCAAEVEGPDKQLAKLEAYPLKITIKVVQETGEPVKGAQTQVGFFNLRERENRKTITGSTNDVGEFAAEYPSHLSECPIEVSRDGYYKSKKFYDGEYDDYRAAMKKGRFEPWNPMIEVTLKKIGNPIPMYVRGRQSGSVFIPVWDKECSFDLLEWDWLPPHGKGKVADWILRAEAGPEGHKTLLRFGNEHDGILRVEKLKGTESLLQSPRQAPPGKYDIRRLLLDAGAGNGLILENDKQKIQPGAYILRLRTTVDGTGQVTSCLYGKMYRYPIDDIPILRPQVVGQDDGSIRFGLNLNNIYINPTPMDRNLECNRNSLYPDVDQFGWAP